MTPVVAGNVESPALHEHPEGEENLGEVVHQQDLLQLKRLPVLHQPANKNSVDSSEQVTRLFAKFQVKSFLVTGCYTAIMQYPGNILIITIITQTQNEGYDVAVIEV